MSLIQSKRLGHLHHFLIPSKRYEKIHEPERFQLN